MYDKARYTPWKAVNHINQYLSLPIIRIYFYLNGVRWGKNWRIYGFPIIQRHRQSSMQFGDELKLRSVLRSNPLAPNHPVILTTWQADALLKIGNDFAMTGGVLCVAERISIENHVMVGSNCTITDTDFHPIDPALRRIEPMAARPAPVHIENDVFIGMNSLILKGVTLGKGCVIGAGSVVTKDVPANTIAAGNPAKVIRTI